MGWQRWVDVTCKVTALACVFLLAVHSFCWSWISILVIFLRILYCIQILRKPHSCFMASITTNFSASVVWHWVWLGSGMCLNAQYPRAPGGTGDEIMATKYIRSWFILPPPPASLRSYSASCASTVLLSLFVWCKRIVKEMSHCSVYSYNPLKNLFHYTLMHFIKGCLLGDGILNCVMRSSLPCFPTLPYISLRVHYLYIFLTKLMHLYGCFSQNRIVCGKC